jgi:peptidoglycan-N-acetylglucosamine deacetylase
MDWGGWLERWFERRYQIRPIGEGGSVLRLGIIRYRGPRVTLKDGTVVALGDPVGELHLDNRRVAALHAEGRAGLRYRREVFRVLPALARDLRTRPEYRAVNAVCGASLFWAEAELAGFEHRPLPAFTRWWLAWWERYLLARYHPLGRRRLDQGRRTELRQIWISRRTILERYGRDAPP